MGPAAHTPLLFGGNSRSHAEMAECPLRCRCLCLVAVCEQVENSPVDRYENVGIVVVLRCLIAKSHH